MASLLFYFADILKLNCNGKKNDFLTVILFHPYPQIPLANIHTCRKQFFQISFRELIPVQFFQNKTKKKYKHLLVVQTCSCSDPTWNFTPKAMGSLTDVYYQGGWYGFRVSNEYRVLTRNSLDFRLLLHFTQSSGA